MAVLPRRNNEDRHDGGASATPGRADALQHPSGGCGFRGRGSGVTGTATSPAGEGPSGSQAAAGSGAREGESGRVSTGVSGPLPESHGTDPDRRAVEVEIAGSEGEDGARSEGRAETRT